MKVGADWKTLGLSFIANGSQVWLQMYCGFSLIFENQLSSNLGFSLSSFRIGDGFVGRMRELKLYHLALGKESLTRSTTSKNS